MGQTAKHQTPSSSFIRLRECPFSINSNIWWAIPRMDIVRIGFLDRSGCGPRSSRAWDWIPPDKLQRLRQLMSAAGVDLATLASLHTDDGWICLQRFALPTLPFVWFCTLLWGSLILDHFGLCLWYEILPNLRQTGSKKSSSVDVILAGMACQKLRA